MSIANWTAYKLRRDTNAITYRGYKVGPSTGAAGRLASTWKSAGMPATGANPTTAAVPTNATTGAIDFVSPSGTMRLYKIKLFNTRADVEGPWILLDRLSHTGGLSGTAAGAQTTNLPTAALTRYTDGIGVTILLEIYTAVGVNAITVTASYTNQGSTSGRTTQAVNFGGNSAEGNAGQVVELPLQSGDYGVKSVESVTLSATSGTAGNFGVTLAKPIMMLPQRPYMLAPAVFDAALELGGCIQQIQSDACLFELVSNASATNTGTPSYELTFAED